MKYAQLVMGPAGTGKSTFCNAVQDHAATTGRVMRVVNLDPAAEAFKYSLSGDVRELISLDDVTETLHLGPNGGLVYCMEYLADNLDWLEEVLADVGDDDYVLFDCPGQIELYSHVFVMKRVVELLQRLGFNVCGVFLIDSLTVTDASKLLSACLTALTAMVQLEVPHINVLSKCDLADEAVVASFLDPDTESVINRLHSATGPRFRRLNIAFGEVLRDYSLVSFVPLNIKEEDSVALVLAHIDNSIQYGEDMEPREVPDEADPVAQAPDPDLLPSGATPSDFFASAAALSSAVDGGGGVGAGVAAGAGAAAGGAV